LIETVTRDATSDDERATPSEAGDVIALIARLKAGDPAAFDQAYALYHKRVYGFIARMVQRREVAEDMTQETWLKLASHAARLRDDTNLAAWLFTVARNLCRSYHRWRVLDNERLSELSLARYRRDTTSPFETTVANQLEQRLESTLASLPPRYREVVILVLIERMTPQEAAGVLGLKSDALRQRLARARAMIVASLHDMFEPAELQ
jgi:RNA polymerase sigma-70 factor (ECF subfamily)